MMMPLIGGRISGQTIEDFVAVGGVQPRSFRFADNGFQAAIMIGAELFFHGDDFIVGKV